MYPTHDCPKLIYCKNSVSTFSLAKYSSRLGKRDLDTWSLIYLVQFFDIIINIITNNYPSEDTR